MQNFSNWLRRLLTEWIFIASATALVTTSLYLKRLPSYSIRDVEILYILCVLFITIKGLEQSGFFSLIVSKIGDKRLLTFYLIVTTMVLSMFITNDIALLLIVPITLSLNMDKREIMVILETIAANAGSALTPFGNPQNLFIYWFYHLKPLEFIKVIMPLTFLFFILLCICSFFIKVKAIPSVPKEVDKRKLFLYMLFLIIFILAVFRKIPLWTGVIIISYAIFLDRGTLRIDYILLATFFCFFGFTDNLLHILNVRVESSEQVFLFSALLSQFVSNVPSALFFCDFTQNWRALLWGVNVGGFGSLIGSLASLIAYRFIVLSNCNQRSFLIKFHIAGLISFIFGCILYFLLL